MRRRISDSVANGIPNHPMPFPSIALSFPSDIGLQDCSVGEVRIRARSQWYESVRASNVKRAQRATQFISLGTMTVREFVPEAFHRFRVRNSCDRSDARDAATAGLELFHPFHGANVPPMCKLIVK
jgi:hypothetical protein